MKKKKKKINIMSLEYKLSFLGLHLTFIEMFSCIMLIPFIYEPQEKSKNQAGSSELSVEKKYQSCAL